MSSGSTDYDYDEAGVSVVGYMLHLTGSQAFL